ncbi:MAG: UDP-N-acetylmuramate dehydrogenase [Rhodospirillaceae bacterium]|nr:UDP-N-acetylmuramate dehydrogenase [Rhodospirillaceae bacterium]
MIAAMRRGRNSSRLRYDEPMSRHTSWRIGGCADVFFRPAGVAELTDFVDGLDKEQEILWIGLGSNLLVRDGGIRGVVICTLDLASGIKRLDGGRLSVGSGVPCASLARQCTRWRLGPAAFFAGIPGTVGGALAMNAGAFGGETWDSVESVDTLDRKGRQRTRSRAEYRVGYRSVTGVPGEWFLGATLALSNDPEADMSQLAEMRRRRDRTQPLGVRSCGSVFRNPPGDFAARLIEASGLKGRRVGDAMVSEKHANFIINRGHAAARDVERLIAEVRDRVATDSGIVLELEVCIVGESNARS